MTYIKSINTSIDDGDLYLACIPRNLDETHHIKLQQITVTSNLSEITKFINCTSTQTANWKINDECDDLRTDDGISLCRLLVMNNLAAWTMSCNDWSTYGRFRTTLKTWKVSADPSSIREHTNIRGIILKEYYENRNGLHKCSLPMSNQAILIENDGRLERGRIAPRINFERLRIFTVDNLNKSIIVNIDKLFELSDAWDEQILAIPIRRFTTKNIDFDLDLKTVLTQDEMDDVYRMKNGRKRLDEVINSKDTFVGIVTQVLDDGHIAIIPQTYAQIDVKCGLGTPAVLFALRNIMSKIYSKSMDATIDEMYHEISVGSTCMAKFHTGYVARVNIIEIVSKFVRVIDIDCGKMALILKSNIRFLPDDLVPSIFHPLAITLKIEMNNEVASKQQLKRAIDEICTIRPLQRWSERKLSKKLMVQVLRVDIVSETFNRRLFTPDSPPDSPPVTSVSNHRNEIVYQEESVNLFDDFDINLNALKELASECIEVVSDECSTVIKWDSSIESKNTSLIWDKVSFNCHLQSQDGPDGDLQHNWNDVRKVIKRVGIKTGFCDERQKVFNITPVRQVNCYIVKLVNQLAKP